MKRLATLFALLAAGLYAINIPLSKLLLHRVAPTMMAAFLYLGAGLGLTLWGLCSRKTEKQPPLTRTELPYTLGMILLDIAAPILLMIGLRRTNAASASLLNNFEIVATALIALVVFKEVLSRRLTLAILLVTLASVALSFDSSAKLQFHKGSLLILAAACCWGLENNCTRMLSSKSSVQITAIKGIFSGLGSLVVALVQRQAFPGLWLCLAVLLLGFVSYGLSINFYIRAQRDLGAAKTSAYYCIAPFLGVVLSFALGERPGIGFYIGLAIMTAATVLMIRDTVSLNHIHEHIHIHTHAHSHGQLTHTHEHAHVHAHVHTHGQDEGAHGHEHPNLEDHDHEHP